MSECGNVSKSDFLSELESHKCYQCNKCLVCHHCLLARGYLRKRNIDVKGMLDIISKSYVENDPPRYIFVGPNNEIVEGRPKKTITKDKTHPNNKTDTYQDKYPDDIDPLNDDEDLLEVVDPVSFGGIDSNQDLEPVFADNQDLEPAFADNQDLEPASFTDNQDQPASFTDSEDPEPITIDNKEEPVSKPDENVVYECDKCSKVLSSEHDFNLHKIYHSVEEIHKCKICFRTFKYSYELIKHSLYHDDKSFLCDFCDKPFPTEERLKMHMRYHTGERPFVCSICEKAFKEKAHLKAHLLIHTNERPYQCDICGRGFRVKLKLERHYWIHDGIKPYLCLVCEKSFRHKCNLRTHVKRHHSYSLESSDPSAEINA